jgi:hypothetical protein
MSWQSPPLGVVQVDYRGSRFLLGRTSDGYAIWDTSAGGAPLERFSLSAEGWAAAWQRYRELEGPGADAQAASWTPSPIATWQRGRPLALAPMGVGQILDGAIKLYRMHFRTLIPLVALVEVPLAILQFTLLRLTVGDVLGRVERGAFVSEQEAFDFLTGILVSSAISAVIAFVATGFLTAAIVLAAGDAFLGQDVAFGATAGAAFRRTHSVLWVLFLSFLGIIGLMVPGALFVVVGAITDSAITGLGGLFLVIAFVFAIVFFVRWMFGPAVVMLEDTRGTKALGRSWRLVRGKGWKVFGTWFLAALLAGIIGSIIATPLQLVSDTQGGIVGPLWYLYPIGSAVGAMVSTPFSILVIVLLYFDARMRKEGFDLDVMAAQLEARA